MAGRVAAREGMTGLEICIKKKKKNSRRIFYNEVNDTLRKVMSGTFTVDGPLVLAIILRAKNERKRAEIRESTRGPTTTASDLLALLIKLAAQPLPALPLPLLPPSSFSSSSSLYVNLLRGCILFFARVLSALPPSLLFPNSSPVPPPSGVPRIPLY